MNLVLLTVVGIAGATVLGSVLGYTVRHISSAAYGLVSSVAAGVMLCAAIHGLIMPALEAGGTAVCLGIAAGVLLLRCLNGAVVPLLKRYSGNNAGRQTQSILFVFVMGLHHIPEGMAAGVSFGTGEAAETVAVCTAVALQTIPEAMMVIPAMAQTGMGRKATVCAAVCCGGTEILGLLFGNWAVGWAATALPFFLSVAAGAMLFVILEEFLPDCYGEKSAGGTYGVLAGYCGMIFLTQIVENWL